MLLFVLVELPLTMFQSVVLIYRIYYPMTYNIFTWLCINLLCSLKTRNYHDANFVVTGSTGCCRYETWQQNALKFEPIYKKFLSRKCIWKCRIQNVILFGPWNVASPVHERTEPISNERRRYISNIVILCLIPPLNENVTYITYM